MPRLSPVPFQYAAPASVSDRGVFDVDPLAPQLPPADARAVDLTDASGATIGHIWLRRQDGAMLERFAWALLNEIDLMPPSVAYLRIAP